MRKYVHCATVYQHESDHSKFQAWVKMASMKDDGITDKNEEKMIKEITKDLERLQKTLDSYEYV